MQLPAEDSVPPTAAQEPSTRTARLSGVECGGLVFDATFDSGNAAPRVEQLGDDEFGLWTLRDCDGSPFENGCRTWFSFSVRGAAAGRTLAFRIHNMNSQGNLFRHDMRPVVRSLPSRPTWERLAAPTTHWGGKASDKYREMRENTRSSDEDGFVLRFEHTVEPAEPGAAEETLYFAFCFPATYTESIARLAWLDALFGRPGARVRAPSATPTSPPPAIASAPEPKSLAPAEAERAYPSRAASGASWLS